MQTQTITVGNKNNTATVNKTYAIFKW